MVVGGLPEEREGHVGAVLDMALDMLDALKRLNLTRSRPIHLRIGVNTGPVVAGVIGTRKFLYDLWGDTVNTASRMESSGVAGMIQVTAESRARAGEAYRFERRGVIEVKGKGEMETFFLLGKR